ncbi:MAG TPA: hypothetical protein DDW76_34865 [Cyanobacteria bacterium UBA11369]|nr:hypothetical protein [Cyanobacteria bacterium UBA11371]HBE35805.1 hypothetical protein [Cyanobacteria bacterium UBA11368]HBE53794.1 hypothetical protein [Cyanobacteria bacterium UBA11369]
MKTTQPSLKKLATFGLMALAATSLSMMSNTGFSPPAVAQQIRPYSVDPNIALDGDWTLSWRSNGITHRARLSMDGNFGTMVVNARLPNGRLISAQQRMTLTPTSNGFILRGSRPTYPGSRTPHPNYNPDVFRIQPNRSSSLNVRNCSGGFCVPVTMRSL